MEVHITGIGGILITIGLLLGAVNLIAEIITWLMK